MKRIKRRNMSDERYRALERAALAGDPDALLHVSREKVRLGEEDEAFLRRATWLHEDLLNIPNYYDPKNTIVAEELRKRIALLQSYILVGDDEIRRTNSKYNAQDILDVVVIEDTMNGGCESASGEYADYSYDLVTLHDTEKERVADVWGFNESSMSNEMETYYNTEPGPLTRAEVDFLFTHVGAIVHNSSQGFREVTWFDKLHGNAGLNAVWEECLAEFEEPEEDEDGADE